MEVKKNKKKKKVQENVMVTRTFPENKVHFMDFYFKTGSVHDWCDNDSFIKSTSIVSTFYPIVISPNNKEEEVILGK